MRILLLPFIWLGRVLHWLRVGVLNLLTLAVLAFIAIGLIAKSPHHVAVPSKAALVLAPNGPLLYVRSQSWEQRLFDDLNQRKPSGVLVRHMVEAIDRAATDPRIHLLELNLSDFGGGSITQLDTVARALQRFRASGKPIYAYAPAYTQGSYLLAAQANHIYMPSLGMALIGGFTADHLYFKGLLDKLGVTVYAFRKGKYKSAVEPLTRTDMSAAAQTENEAWLSEWWKTYVDTVAKGRKLPAAHISAYADNLSQLITASGGNGAELALKQGLITHIGNERSFKRAIAAKLQQPVRKLHSIDLDRYLAATQRTSSAKDIIAVVPIDGALMPGSQDNPGTVAATLTVDQIDRLVHDKNVKAVVLQVNSPGGSVDAAEAIREAVLRLRKAGKPVVVSMGTLGASGAYWLSTAADRIYAHPTTLAADIGVFALFPNYAGTLAKLGIGYSGVATTPSAGALSPYAPLTPTTRKAMQAVVDHLYGRFVKLVAHARHLSLAQAGKVAQGRAWSGVDARRLGLVDGLGGMREALAETVKLAKLKTGAYRVDYLPEPRGSHPFALARHVAMLSLREALLPAGLDTPPVSEGLAQMRLLLDHAQPYGLFAYLPVAPRIR
ncbi:signal peptide peptidase SppA [Acidihalobacter ferrooxydans]|uniref:Signal peptide peptidase SppA n=1 Tax=Acidihalobacter ferrooxydans TaxID=1765967 RepID=A0A1P8UDZ3_9GAMM|nr:signal peptide peptidase SppA [Acidihalobacter ferrooxydans]APZ42009.1 signal peptide peptidase SppA [Acidihalobacter ferrooxydans]